MENIMTSTTAVSVPVTFVEKWVTVVKAHEKLIIVAIAAFLLFHFYGAGLNAWVNHDEKQQTIAEQTLAEQTQTDAQLAAQNAALLAQEAAANAALAKAATVRDAQTKTQQTVDQTLPLPALGQRWELLLNLQPSDIVPTNDGSLTVSSEAAHTTVAALETIPTSQADLAGDATVIANDQKVETAQTTQIAGLDKQITDADVACKAQVATEKAKARRSKFRWFKIGVGVGFVGGLFAGHSL
jgi:hypothetical protein